MQLMTFSWFFVSSSLLFIPDVNRQPPCVCYPPYPSFSFTVSSCFFCVTFPTSFVSRYRFLLSCPSVMIVFPHCFFFFFFFCDILFRPSHSVHPSSPYHRRAGPGEGTSEGNDGRSRAGHAGTGGVLINICPAHPFLLPRSAFTTCGMHHHDLSDHHVRGQWLVVPPCWHRWFLVNLANIAWLKHDIKKVSRFFSACIMQKSIQLDGWITFYKTGKAALKPWILFFPSFFLELEKKYIIYLFFFLAKCVFSWQYHVYKKSR